MPSARMCGGNSVVYRMEATVGMDACNKCVWMQHTVQ